jgi:hypothetical protein
MRRECEVDGQILVAKDGFLFAEDWVCEGWLKGCMLTAIAASE